MIVWEIIRVAFAALVANKGRALLTMLGIIIGVGAVITMMAIGEGASKAVQDRITALGTNLLFVNSEWNRGRSVGAPVPITVENANALASKMRYAAAVVPEINRSYQVKWGNTNLNANVNATTPEFFAVRKFDIVNGRIFNRAEVDGRRRIVVLGADAADNLGGGPAMVGETIRIAGGAYEVIGVLDRKGSQGGWNNPDEQFYIPLQTGQYRLMGTENLRSVTVHVADQNRMNDAAQEIERILRVEHKLRPDQENDFSIRNQLDIMETFAETSRTFSMLLASIAAVSLVVGGIGIMNIMLVSVTERTREIGIRMAIGAQRLIILLQFLLESIVLCVLGGLIGIAGGVGAAKLIANTGGWSVIVTPESIMLAVGFSLGVGLFFGIYPASRAARLDPIVALRYE